MRRARFMFARFCLYGFLKNQRYFEPFLVLALLERGQSFTAIGFLIAVREVTTNLLEVLSGALADTWGRRRSMIASFAAYIASFATLAVAQDVSTLAAAMVLYGVGEAFRSGTHKAMILTWLRAEGRAEERTEVYGHTRSWSKLGSSWAVVCGATWVLGGGGLDGLFWLAIAPYVLGLVNLASYPMELEGEGAGELSACAIWENLVETASALWGSASLRGLLYESSGFMGAFKVSKDYLQPILATAATVGVFSYLGEAGWTPAQRTALVVGPVYFSLFLMSAAVSRRAGRLADWAGGEDEASRWLWWAFAGCFVSMIPAVLWGWEIALIAGFMGLYMLESLWRPLVLSRLDARGGEGATLLSIESQARSLTTMVLAPLVGALVDVALASGSTPWWPVVVMGAVVGVIGVVYSGRGAGGPGGHC